MIYLNKSLKKWNVIKQYTKINGLHYGNDEEGLGIVIVNMRNGSLKNSNQEILKIFLPKARFYLVYIYNCSKRPKLVIYLDLDNRKGNFP